MINFYRPFMFSTGTRNVFSWIEGIQLRSSIRDGSELRMYTSSTLDRGLRCEISCEERKFK
jgi:hypothetical protein